MKINQIDIEAFAELSEFSLSLEPDFQIVYAEHIQSVQRFIKAMFYGLKDSDIKQVFSVSRPSGRIMFSHEGFTYQLRRTFSPDGTQNTTDLIIETSGEKVRLNNADRPGVELFHLSESEFNNIAFFENPLSESNSLNRSTPALDHSESLSQAHSLILDNGETKIDQNNGSEYPEETSGHLQKLLERKAQLEQELNALQETNQIIDHVHEDIRQLNDHLSELSEREESLLLQSEQHQKLHIVHDFQQYEKLKRQLNQLADHDLSEKDSVLKSKSITVKELSEIAAQRQRAALALSDYEIKVNALANKRAEEDAYKKQTMAKKYDILQERSRLQYLQKQSANREVKEFRRSNISLGSLIPFFILEAFFLLGGLLLRKKSSALSAVLIVLAVLLPFLMVIFYSLLRKKQESRYRQYKMAVRNQEIRKLEIANQLKELEWTLKRMESHTGDFETEIEQLEQEVAEKKRILDKEKNKLKYAIKPYFTELPDDDQLDAAIQILREQTADTVQNEQKIQALREQMRDIIADRTPSLFYQQYRDAQDWLTRQQSRLRTFPEFRENHIRAQLQGIAEDKISFNAQLNEYEKALEQLPDKKQNPAPLQAELKQITDQIKLTEFNYAFILISKKLMAQSPILNSKNQAELFDKAVSYLSRMTDDELNQHLIEDDLIPELNAERSEFQQINYYQPDLIEKIYLALRLVLSEASLVKAGEIPLLLDDPAEQADLPAFKALIRFLKELGRQQRRQIIYFSGRELSSDTADNQDFYTINEPLGGFDEKSV